MASKLGKFLESLTSDALDLTTIEDIVLKKLVENLQAEGLKGEVASVRGLELEEKELEMHEGLRVRRHHTF